MKHVRLVKYLDKYHPTGCKLRAAVCKIAPVIGHTLPKRGFGPILYSALGGKQKMCLNCDMPTKFKSFYKGYHDFCSIKCASILEFDSSKTGRPCRPYIKKLEHVFVKHVESPTFNRVRKSKYWIKIQSLASELGVPYKTIIYHMFVSPDIPACPTCGDPPSLEGIKSGYKMYCCVECANADAALLQKGRRWQQTCFGKYGVSHHMQHQSAKDKIIGTNLNRRGVEHVFQDNVVKRKSRKTCMANYGTENPMHSQNVKDRVKSTSMSRYGVSNPMQNKSVFHKNQVSRMSVKWIKLEGKLFSYQGYEHFLLRRLVEKFGPDRVQSGKKAAPDIWYSYKGVVHRYYPDVMLDDDYLYEVKSTYTFGVTNKEYFSVIKAKAKACHEAGYKFKCVVYSDNGEVLLNTDMSEKYDACCASLR